MTQNRNVTTVHLFNVSHSVNVIIRIKDQISPSGRNTRIVVYCFDELSLKIILNVFIENRQIATDCGAYSTAVLICLYMSKVRPLFDCGVLSIIYGIIHLILYRSF